MGNIDVNTIINILKDNTDLFIIYVLLMGGKITYEVYKERKDNNYIPDGKILPEGSLISLGLTFTIKNFVINDPNIFEIIMIFTSSIMVVRAFFIKIDKDIRKIIRTIQDK